MSMRDQRAAGAARERERRRQRNEEIVAGRARNRFRRTRLDLKWRVFRREARCAQVGCLDPAVEVQTVHFRVSDDVAVGTALVSHGVEYVVPDDRELALLRPTCAAHRLPDPDLRGHA